MSDLLVVEDSATQAEELRLILEADGFAVTVARNGEAALECLARKAFDLVLSDVVMPGLSGYELCRRVKSDPRTRHTPFVLLTHLTDPLDVFHGLECGADNFITKPFDPQYLVQRIRSILAHAPTPDSGMPGTLLTFRGKGITITADKAQILDLLLAALEESSRARQREREARQGEAEAVAASEALVESDRRKNLFLAMLAHELRGPMAPLMNSLHILEQAEIDPAARRECLQRMRRQLGHLSRLTDDLLEASRVAQGKIHIRPERLDLARLARTAAEDHRTSLAKAGLGLTVEAPETPVWTTGDPTRLAQVLANLLDNAAHHTEPGGRVTVRVRSDPERGQAVVSVIDTGEGIDPELLPRLFHPFVQAEQGPDRARGGLGLGLAVVKGLLELHQGTVEAASEGPGRGAVFTVRLPLLQGPAALKKDAARPPAGGPGRRVLVIEDEPDAAESLCLLLRLLGHQTQAAHSGPDGVRVAAEWLPEVVVSDLGLPGFDGHEVARRVRRLPGMEKALLIALTGYGSEEDRQKSREAGFHHHFVKPADPAQIQRTLAGTPSG